MSRAISNTELEGLLTTDPLLKQIIRPQIRSDGNIYGLVHLNLIDETERLPFNKVHAEALAEAMREQARKLGGTGQKDPISIHHIRGAERFQIADGIHRHRANIHRSATIEDVNVTPYSSRIAVLRQRIVATVGHAGVKAARLAKWIEEEWMLSELGKIIEPLPAYKLSTYSQSDVDRLGISPDQIPQINDQVAQNLRTWGLKPKDVLRSLELARAPDEIIYNTVGGSGNRKNRRHFSVGTAVAIARGGFDHTTQRAIGEIVLERNLGESKADELVAKVRRHHNGTEPVTAEEVAGIIDSKPNIVDSKDYDAINKEILRLGEEVAIKTTNAIRNYLFNNRLTLTLTPDNPAGFFSTSAGASGSQIRDNHAQTSQNRRPPTTTTTSFRPLLETDLREFDQLKENSPERNKVAAIILSSIGFDPNYSNIRNLQQHTDDRGIQWITITHPKESLIAKCHGNRVGDAGFDITGIQIYYSQQISRDLHATKLRPTTGRRWGQSKSDPKPYPPNPNDARVIDIAPVIDN